MIKKMISVMGAFGILASSAFAASATVWNNEDGNGTVAPAVWYSYPEKGAANANGATATLTTGTDKSKVLVASVSTSNVSSSAGLGFNWSKTSNGTISLADYAGICVTYSATQPVQVEFKQPSVKDFNYHGIRLPAKTAKDTLFIAFTDLAQDSTWGTAVNFDVDNQQSVQFAYKQSIAKETGAAKNTITLYGLSLGSSCSQHAPMLSDGYANGDANTLDEGKVLTLDLNEVFTDEDDDNLTYTVDIRLGASSTRDAVKLVDSLYAKNGILNLTTGSNPAGTATVTVTAIDPTMKSATYEFTVETIDGENAPVAVDDSYTTQEEKTLTVTLKNFVIENDYDADGDAFVPSRVSDVSHGTLYFDVENGKFTYIPEHDFFGEDHFTYQLTEKPRADGSYAVKTSNVATVTISVTNVDDPIQVVVVDSVFEVDSIEYKLMKDTLEVEEDFNLFTVKIPTANVVFSDPDLNAASLQVKAMSSGVVSVDVREYNDNYFIEVDAIEDANGVAKVTLFANDNGDTARVWFFVKVNPIADKPRAVDDSYTVVQDSVNKIAANRGVLKNDVNPDGKTTLKAYLLSGAAEGTVTLAEDGG